MNKRRSVAFLCVHGLLLLWAALFVAGMCMGGVKAAWRMDAETVTYLALMFFSLPFSVLSLVRVKKGLFAKKAAVPIALLSALNLLISIGIWSVVVLVFGIFMLLSIFR